MNENQIKLEDMTATALQDVGEITHSIIESMVRSIAPIVKVYDEGEIKASISKLEERFDISMNLGSIFAAEDYLPWLDDSRGEIDWYYWNRYKRLLGKGGFPPKVITALDSITDRITDHLENPKKNGEWARKGLVVGHVQSGKTANYTGVICKAADSGYRVVIVLAGLLNSLRNQTQERIDEGFTGVDSSRQLDNVPLSERLIGVGKFNHDHVPVTFTTSIHDFSRNIAQQIGAGLGSFNDPVVLVIKKNKSIIQNLITWLRNNNLNLNKFPFLLIDDEADHASINTNKSGEDATAINSKIREMLGLFSQSMYLGYTATPFANVFIDPASSDAMLGDELFPRDFIISLDPPSNYVGSTRIFGENADLDVVREIDDYEDLIPLQHKKELEPVELPISLKEAICIFILSRAVRLLRKQEKQHNSMLVNVSRFTDVQSHLKLLTHDYVDELRQSIYNYYALPEPEALKNSFIQTLKNIWEKELYGVEYDWLEIQHILKDAVSPIRVIEVNASKNSDSLDYSRKNYPNGRNVIAIGGMSLSRGLTLEGLTVSYFLRNTQMYDTLMQMGRWFGYRDGYIDLCRIYMPTESIAWYQHISDVLEELRSEFKRMEQAQMTPKDFGLCVRSHPESLIVTARNKMRTGLKVPRQISLYGRQVETTALSKSKQNIADNWQSLEYLIQEVVKNSTYKKDKSNHLFEKVPVDCIKEFICSYQNHPASYLTEPEPILDYIGKLSTDGDNAWDLLLVNSSSNTESLIQKDINGLPVRALRRTVHEKISGALTSDNRRFSSGSWSQAGLSIDKISAIKAKYSKNTNIPSNEYCSVRDRPLLMLYVLDCKKDKDSEPIVESGAVAWAISFPGQAGKGRPERLVEYVVNSTWWNNEYGDTFDEEEWDNE